MTKASRFDPSGFYSDEQDHTMVKRYLCGFIPPELFDVHVHAYDLSVFMKTENENGMVGNDAYRTGLELCMKQAVANQGVMFAFPTPDLDIQKANARVIDEVAGLDTWFGFALVSPTMDSDEIESMIIRHRLRGFKVYHYYAQSDRTFEAAPSEYMADWMWELADRHRLVMMVHLVKARALADPQNHAYIREKCMRYPHARVILAHAARGFCYRHTMEGLDHIEGLDNIYFDTSAICEPEAFVAIIQRFGVSRLLYGTDFPVCMMHTRAVTVGDGFYWITEQDIRRSRWTLGGPALLWIEMMLAIRQACMQLKLGDRDIQRIFYDNAQQMFENKSHMKEAK